MIVLGIVGSPRKHANSTSLLKQVLTGAEANGADTEVIIPWEHDVGPCLACVGCHTTGRCTVEDDFQRIYGQILGCDALVLATPVYFGAVSAQVKPLIDRCESFWGFSFRLGAAMPPGPSGGKRRGVLVATAGKDQDIMFTGPRITFDFLMRSLQGQVFAELLYGGLDTPGAIRSNKAAMSRAFEAGKKLVLDTEWKERLAKQDAPAP